VRFTSRPFAAIVTGVLLALAFTWAGLSIASYSPHPVSFFITSLAFGTYVVIRLAEPISVRLRGWPQHQVVEAGATEPTELKRRCLGVLT